MSPPSSPIEYLPTVECIFIVLFIICPSLYLFGRLLFFLLYFLIRVIIYMVWPIIHFLYLENEQEEGTTFDNLSQGNVEFKVILNNSIIL